MTWLVLFFVLTLCDDQKREYKGRRNQSSQIKMIFAVPFNTESHNAWRFHKLITGFFWRRELGLPVIAYAVLFTSSYRKKEAKQTSDSVRQLFLAFPHANNLQRLFFPNQELTRNQLAFSGDVSLGCLWLHTPSCLPQVIEKRKQNKQAIQSGNCSLHFRTQITCNDFSFLTRN